MNKKTDWSKLEPRICEFCNESYCHRPKTEKAFQFRKRRFCSNKCKMAFLADYWRGRRKYNYKRVERVCIWCGKSKLVAVAYSKRPFCNRICMAEWMSENQRGANHWHWQGGITEKKSRDNLYEGYKEWRRKVYKRDNFQCQVCDSNERLEAHHIKPRSEYPELILDIDNGITLCKKCHKEVHYGKKVQSQNSWERANSPTVA